MFIRKTGTQHMTQINYKALTAATIEMNWEGAGYTIRNASNGRGTPNKTFNFLKAHAAHFERVSDGPYRTQYFLPLHRAINFKAYAKSKGFAVLVGGFPA